MEAFSLLNYWKNNTTGLTFIPPSSDSSSKFSGEPTTIVTSVTETDEEDDDGEEDEGPFFDLEFTPPLEDEDSDCTDSEEVDPELDDVYFNGQIVEEDEEEDEEEVEPPSSSSTEQTCSVKAPAAQLSASILKSATKLRVFMLKMKKSKLKLRSEQTLSPESQQKNTAEESNSESQLKSTMGELESESQQKSTVEESKSESQQKSTVTVNLKVEEIPIISLFARDSSSRNTSSSSSSTSSSSSSLKKQNGNETCVLEENRFVMMQKYLKKVKPLYVRVSRRYGEKLQLRHSAAEKKETPATETTTIVKKSLKPGNMNMSINIPAGLKVVRKHLGKSRSSSSTTATTESKAATTSVTTVTESRRRDDSLLQQQDSIQSAILHCKRSFNSSRDKDSSVLPRSVSDSSTYDK